MANDLLAIVSSSNSLVAIVAVAADAVVDVDGPAQDHHVADMTDVMIVAVVAAVVTVEADAVEDHIELNGPCLSRIFHLDAGKVASLYHYSVNGDFCISPFFTFECTKKISILAILYYIEHTLLHYRNSDDSSVMSHQTAISIALRLTFYNVTPVGSVIH